MRKTLMIFLGLLVFILPLSAYSVSVLKSSTIHQEQTNSDHSSNKIIRKNQLNWQKQTAKVDVIESDELTKNEFVATSMDQLKNHSKSVIKGQVYNLQKMVSPKNMVYTKATIHIDKVLSGDHSLQGQNVYIALAGGLVSFNHWYANMNHQKDDDREILVNNEEAPLAKIGSQIITGLVPNPIDESSDYNASLKQSGFTINNSYAVDNLQYNFWIKNKNQKKFVLNNPQIKKKSAKNSDLTRELDKLTTEINKKYNK